MGRDSNLRQFLRVVTEVEADVSGAGGTVTGATRDLSLNGMYLHLVSPFPEGSTCRAILFLDGRGGDVQVLVNGYVARCGSDGMAVEFKELIGLDSWEHLRNLIIYNAEDPAKAQREFATHMGLRNRLG
jgi:hypothetical protein